MGLTYSESGEINNRTSRFDNLTVDTWEQDGKTAE